SYSDSGRTSATVAGTLQLEVSADHGIAKAFFLPFQVTVLASGRIEVATDGAVSAVGVYGGSLLNAGYLRVVSTSSGAPVLDANDTRNFFSASIAGSSAVGVSSVGDATFINNGTIEVSS